MAVRRRLLAVSHDLLLGFREKPRHLHALLAEHGLTLHQAIGIDEIFPIRMRTYQYFDGEFSAKSVWFTYHDGVYSDYGKMWAERAPGIKIEASGSVSTYAGRNDHDLEAQDRIARLLACHYGAVLYDPQLGERIL